MAVEDGSDLQAFQERDEESQGSGVDDLFGVCGTTPGEGHGNFSRKLEGNGEETAEV
jgi:hypothetical protein